MSGTEVTCRDLDTGETETAVIRDDYVVIVDGVYEIAHVQAHANGTHVITVRRAGSVKEDT